MGCPACGGTERTVVALERLGVPHGEAGHAFVFRRTRVFECERGHARLWHADHDCFQYEERWDMEWSWAMDAESVAVVRAGFADCPDPMDAECGCAAHGALRDRRWSGHGKTAVAVRVMDGLPRFADQ